MWKDYDWNSATRNCENGKYLANIMDDSAIICDEVIKSCDEEIKPIPTNFNEKKYITCKPQVSYYLFHDVISIKDFDPSNIKIDEKS